MKKLIILSGSSNCGKSETLKLLVGKLGGKLTQKYDDRYVCNKGKLKVAICTPGDNEYIANLNISFFIKTKNVIFLYLQLEAAGQQLIFYLIGLMQTKLIIFM